MSTFNVSMFGTDEGDARILQAIVSPYIAYMPPADQAKLSKTLASAAAKANAINGKYNYYASVTKFPTDKKGLTDTLQKISENISADMIAEGNPASVAEVKTIVFGNKQFAQLWASAKDILTPPSWLLWGVGGVAVVAGLVLLRPYITVLGKFKRQAK